MWKDSCKVPPQSLKVWKWPLEQKIWKKNYTTLIIVKNTANFVLTTFLYDDFFYYALDCVKLNFSDAPHAQDYLIYLSKLLTAIFA